MRRSTHSRVSQKARMDPPLDALLAPQAYEQVGCSPRLDGGVGNACQQAVPRVVSAFTMWLDHTLAAAGAAFGVGQRGFCTRALAIVAVLALLAVSVLLWWKYIVFGLIVSAFIGIGMFAILKRIAAVVAVVRGHKPRKGR